MDSNAGRGRKPRKRNNKRNNKQQQGPKKNIAPPPPQTKLILRNIGNLEKYGTVEQILGMIQKILEISNDKNGSQYTIEVDMASARYLIRADEMAKKYQSDFREAQEGAKEEQQQEEKEAGSEDKPIEPNGDAGSPEGNKSEENAAKDNDSANKLDVLVAPKLGSSVPVITARLLYIDPPKKTRRRGERSGYAYVLLTAPKIEKIELPEEIPETVSESIGDDEGKSKREEEKGEDEDVEDDSKQIKVPDLTDEKPLEDDEPKEETPQPAEKVTVQDSRAPEAAPAKGETGGGNDELTKAIQDTQDNAADAIPDTTSAQSLTNSAKPIPTPDYSSAVAKGRLLLSRVTDFLTELAQEDAKGPQEYSGCKIEPAMSGKTWKRASRGDRREGTIEGTADYKNWLQGLTKKQEELSARPKPTPGGGGATNPLLADGSLTAEQGLPVSSLVQHLRAKHQELKRKKAKKKKDKGKSSKKKGTTGKAIPGATAAGVKKKKKKKAIKKNAPKKAGAVSPAPFVAPTLLKPPEGPVAR